LTKQNKRLTWFVTRLEERQLQTSALYVGLHLYKGLGIQEDSQMDREGFGFK